MRFNSQLAVAVSILTLMGAGCFQSVTVPNVAETLGAAKGAAGGVAQYGGFGKLGKLLIPAPNDTAVVRIVAELPSLQPNVTVTRLPGSGLDQTQFQNLTDAIKFPVGLLGDNPTNLAYGLTWSDGRGYVWTYSSQEEKIHFARIEAAAEPGIGMINNENSVILLVKDFLTKHGIGELTYRNLAIAPEWKSATGTGQEVPVTYERVVDERNIVDAIGQPELGGRLSVNAKDGTVSSGWIILPALPERSDYPAITATEMRRLLESGGMMGSPQGTVDINETFFAFVRHPQASEYSQDILSPALIGIGTQILDGASRPYRIVVPLIKQ